MKIYYVANARMPSEKAHGIQLAKMCEAFLLSGADLELVLPRRRGSNDDLKRFYGLKVDIPVKRLPVLNLGFIISSLSFMFAYIVYLRGRKGAILYTIDMDNFSFIFLRFLCLPYFSEIHDVKKKTFLWKVFLKKIFGVIVINSKIEKNLIETFEIASEKVIVKPNGIDLEMFSGKISKEEARKKLNLPPDKEIAVYVGREVSWKGMEILTEAQKLLPDEIIHIVSGRPYQEIPYWLSAADLFIVLGTKKNEYSYRHTSPMKLFEYMASGRPILAADTPANREIVSENEAYFYEPDNPKDLADKISKIMTNPPDSKLKIDNARRKVENYTWSKRAQNILEFMKLDARKFGAACFLFDENKNLILLQKRDGNTAMFPNKWGFFGGGLEGNETPKEGLIRELKEEIGLTFREDELIPLWDNFFAEYNVQRSLFVIKKWIPESSMIIGEGEGVKWIPIDEIFEYDLSDFARKDLERFLRENI
ncbi:hypothetical protein A3H65_03995 [Candidatus Giovannonibacteria bacterium RIFCSPLOWO2_02_FULL_45_14]|uniref:Nudix hydrolase domain-containing protein n=1 Tax=Candidatus Giovannonibacteria bacterium RIFCSPLOWO2_12_FULL_44_15 TaxID=1798364 RepID=A0A1F5Y0R3_9BACT|nr:MAG: hypothetical protein A3C75_03195 [Candidatus Giovannonibacteria bacterium RIFCSPHIGHO2_02_FULL_44_31]OGF76651.1 MAG: hypothetical protein A3E62_03405 [Candidatus Giovannonibacteria bacterium RIFCSPHIGHO2_12_FULL_44_29]OGF91225.1 MAG: hypothetical protein A3H65_03995 [Candidatus Giovannonibacteria bacterium RIFCSPLOWO2_02_FULL_45_14]OGF93737.1 MAG: hypothetical protein A3G54_04265 [Candidatus Giovannonibacteria bacterium RIFCSPLOWO2_12_FULL_44_15]